ncbi:MULTISPECIES: hypothetical protein [unclassified Microcoleus]|nr:MULTISPECIES: hypothetical protein [unclassified Microcoleus]
MSPDSAHQKQKRKKEEGRRKKEEGRGKREEGRRINLISSSILNPRLDF